MVGLDNPLHIALVLIVVLMVFGAKRLPEMGKSMGEGLRGFKESLHGDTTTGHSLMTTTDEPVATAPVAPVAATPVASTESMPPAA